MSKVLIAYYTKSGSTLAVAEKLKEELMDTVNRIDVKSIENITDMKGYDIVIIGTPIHGMNLAVEARNFMDQHKKELLDRSVYCYVMSYVYPLGRSFFRKLIEKSVRKASESIQAKGSRIFGGKGEKTMPAPARLLFGLPESTPLDQVKLRDIKEWAQKINMDIV